MMTLLPAAPLGTTHQVSPDRAADPIALAIVVMVVLSSCASDDKDVESLQTPETI